jgi:putative heme-binding domain-containing protein
VKCAEALARVGRAPEDPADLSAALDAAHRLGSLRARRLIEVLLGWASLPPLGPEPSGADARVQEYKSSLASLETWFATTYPKFERKSPDAARGPAWEQDAILAFLTRSAARKGSPARGREVFTRATCARCHVLEGDTNAPATDPSAFHGPDLTTAARRFDDAALLEAIVQPSRAISDQYKNLVVVTDEDERVDGRLVVEEPSSLTLLLSDGQKRKIDRAHVASSRPSDVSPMPEGLIANLTLEDVKDLFAYLRAEGRVDPADAAKPTWHDVLSGKKHIAWIYDVNTWRAKDGVLTGKGEKLERSQYVMSRETFSDFEIEFDVRMPKGNSGFQYRSRIEPGNPDPVGLQADIGQGYWGSLYSSDGRGTIAQMDPKQWVPVLDHDGWNHFFVHVEGDRQWIELNGLTTVDVRDAKFTDGVLGFQVHQGMSMTVTYANVRMRDLR